MGTRNAFKNRCVLLCLITCGLSVAGCLSPITLNRAVIAYDEAVTDSLAKQLLINIARTHHHQAIHFTGVSNIAATFDFRVSAGTTPALTGESGRALFPLFGSSIAENPTFSIVPIEGEEFTRRLLTPFHEGQFTLLLRQRFDIDLLLRLMAQELRVKEERRGAKSHIATRRRIHRGMSCFVESYRSSRPFKTITNCMPNHSSITGDGPFPGTQSRLKAFRR